MHQSPNALVLQFYVHGIPRVARCAFPCTEGALLGQLDDNGNLNRHTLDLLKSCQASADHYLISPELEKTSQTKGFPNSCCWDTRSSWPWLGSAFIPCIAESSFIALTGRTWDPVEQSHLWYLYQTYLRGSSDFSWISCSMSC